jgi:hypothetical protein
MPMAELNPTVEARMLEGVDFAGRFFMGQSQVDKALFQLAERLDAEHIPYAIIGAMALNAYGYRRVTEDVGVLLTADGLARFKERYLGRGYLERFPGSKGLRDTDNSVAIDVVLTGDFPGDGKPKPVAFPDPKECAEQGAKVALVPLTTLVELKLASGMTAPHRLKDLADVLELIRARDLPTSFEADLHPYVQAKFRELWLAAQTAKGE